MLSAGIALLSVLLPSALAAGCINGAAFPGSFRSAATFYYEPNSAPIVSPFLVAGKPVDVFYDSSRLVNCVPDANATVSVTLSAYNPELKFTQTLSLKRLDSSFGQFRPPAFNGTLTLSPNIGGMSVEFYSFITVNYANGSYCQEYDSADGKNYKANVLRDVVTSIKLDVGQTAPIVAGDFEQGGMLAIEHNPARTPQCRGFDRGYPSWGVAAYVIFDSTPIKSYAQTTAVINDNFNFDVKPAVGYIMVPKNATSMQLYFENTDSPRGSLLCRTYDSNNGNNWRYAIGAPRAENTVLTSGTLEEWSSSLGFSTYDAPFLYPSYILAGGRLTLSFSAERLKVCKYDSQNIPTYTVDYNLYSRELNAVQTVRLQEYDNTGRSDYAPYFYENVVVDPRFAAVSTQVEFWAKISCVYPNATAREEYLSNDSKNYIYPIFKKKASAKITFEVGQTAPSIVGNVEAGSVILVSHDPARTPNCRGFWRGSEAWGVNAKAIYDSTPLQYSDSTTGTATGRRIAVIPVPHNATSLQLFFENYYAPGFLSCTSYDSNNGRNFPFTVAVSRETVRVPSAGVASLDVSTSSCLAYNVLPQNNFPANFCEFYVNTVQVDYAARYFTVAAALKPTEGVVLSYGLFVRAVDSNNIPREFFVHSAESSKLTTGFAWGRLFQVQRYTLFLDVKRNNGVVVRLWISNNGADFGVAQLLPAASSGLQTVGSSSIVYDSKRKCQQ